MERVGVQFLPWEELGEVMLGRFGRVPVEEPASPPEWDLFSHVRVDGMGGILHQLKTHEGYDAVAPAGRDPSPPPPRERLRALAAAFERTRTSHQRPYVRWKSFDRRAVPGVPKAVGHALLDRDETRRVLARGKVSSNSRLLWAIDRVVSELAEPLETHLWSMPVNMRGAVKSASSMDNPVSVVPVEFARGAAPLDVHQAVREKLQAGAHWGTWDWMQIGLVQGFPSIRRMIRAYYARPGHAFYGTFSNLGDWTVEGRPTRYWLLAVPPVSIVHPVSACCVAWGGRLSLTVQAHAALSVDPDEAGRWAERWKALALDASVTPSTSA